MVLSVRRHAEAVVESDTLNKISSFKKAFP